MNWEGSGYKVRTEATPIPHPEPHTNSEGLGGPDAFMHVTRCCVNRIEWAREHILHIEKAAGGTIASGDKVSLYVDNTANFPNYYVRTSGPQNGALVNADGTTGGQPDTEFVIEFNQVVAGLGWRPAVVQCPACGPVTGVVIDATTKQAIAGATVKAQDNFKATTGTDGRFTLTNPKGQSCVPTTSQSSTSLTLLTSADTYQTASQTINVPPRGIDVTIELNCINITGTVTSVSTGQPVGGATITLVELGNDNKVLRPDGTFFQATTAANGTFKISCVPKRSLRLQTSANIYQTKYTQVTVPDRDIDVLIKLDCTNVSGWVVDANGQPVSDAYVVLLEPVYRNPGNSTDGSPLETTTDTNGKFTIQCVPQRNWVIWTDGASSIPITVPPEGRANIEIRLGASSGCGNVIGHVKEDSPTSAPIVGAKVKMVGSGQGEDEATTGVDGSFRIECVTPSGNRGILATDNGYQSGRSSVNVPATGDSVPVEIKLKRSSIQLVSGTAIQLTWGNEPPDLDAHLSGPDGNGGRFHLFYSNRTSPPVDFAKLDTDDTDTQGPEAIAIGKSPSRGTFVAGEYHYWVHNYRGSTFAGSDAVVTIVND